MTATNHAITGAVIAIAVKQPILAISLAFVAHFAMDSIPHFGISAPSAIERNKNRKFLAILIVDLALAALLLLILPQLLSNQYQWWVILLSMLACLSPDLVWGIRFYSELKTQLEKPKNLFSRVHTKIQWSETIPGMLMEIIWFFAMLALILAAYLE